MAVAKPLAKAGSLRVAMEKTMKKLTATVICLIVLSMGALPLAAQTRNRSCNNRTTYNTGNPGNTGRYSSRYDARYNRNGRYNENVYRNQNVYNNPNIYSGNDVYYGDDGYVYNDNRSVWDKHRDKITTVAGAVGGAALSGVLGGKKAAIIGAIAGGAGAAVYTYKIRDKYRRY